MWWCWETAADGMIAREGTVLRSLEPVPLISIALGKGGGLGGYVMELCRVGCSGPLSRVLGRQGEGDDQLYLLSMLEHL